MSGVKWLSEIRNVYPSTENPISLFKFYLWLTPVATASQLDTDSQAIVSCQYRLDPGQEN